MNHRKMKSILRDKRFNEFFRGSRRNKVKNGIEEIMKARRKGYDPNMEQIIKSANLVIHLAHLGVHDKYFESLIHSYIDLIDEFNKEYDDGRLRKRKRQLIDIASYGESLKKLSNHLSELNERGENLLERDNPSIKLAKHMVDLID